MAEDDDSKTEQPTEKRLADARRKGEVPQSQELKTWTMLVAATVIVVMMAPSMSTDLTALLRVFLESPHAIAADSEALRQVMAKVSLELGLLLAMPFGLLILTAIGTALAQHGFIVSAERLKPNLNKLNPLKALKRYLSPQPWLELVKGIAKIALVAAVTGFIVWPRRRELELLISMEVPAQLAYLEELLAVVLYTVVAVIGVLAVADFAYQRYSHFKRLRMTRQEVQDEHKQQEGDPHVKSRIRRLRAERARQRMMQAVPTADVIVTNPTHYAVALKYDMEKMNAPTVVAKGVELVAKRIRELAAEHKVEIVENPPLARALYAAVEVDQEIPPEHYKAVAEIIGYVMRLKGKLQR